MRIVSTQSGPIILPNSSRDESTTPFPILKTFGSRKSHNTTGALPATTLATHVLVFTVRVLLLRAAFLVTHIQT